MRVLSFLSLFSTTWALECNICGPGTQNIMGEQLGIVTLEYEGVQYKQNCEKWQDSLLISEEWCEENMLEYTYDICKCVLPDGSLVKDSIVFPTASPAPTFDDPLHDNPSGGDVQPVSLNTTNDGGEASSWSRPRESVVLGMMAGVVVILTVV
jgi:hypothetical protein